MPINEVYYDGFNIPLTVGASKAVGSFVVVGNIPGVTLTATGASGTTTATVATQGVYNLSVHGYTTVNAAVAVGDIIYFDSTDSNKLNKNPAAVRFGYALGVVGSGNNTVIPVKVGY